MKYRRQISILLALCIVFSVLPGTVFAASTMEASDALVSFIKQCEGFTKYAIWDYQQYSIGYGSACDAGEYPNGITEAEADALLRIHIRSVCSAVNEFVTKHQLTPTQGQFDAMASITYGLGSAWMNTNVYRLPRLICEGCTELELLNCLGDWVIAGGQMLDALAYRRMRENYIYFHDEYRNTNNIANDTPYACVKLDANGGEVSCKRQYTFRGQAIGLAEPLPVPTRDGYRFVGWADAKGNPVSDKTIAADVMSTYYAKWMPLTGDLYTDVREKDWFYASVKAATESKLFDGFPDGSFRPQQTITRAEFAKVLYQAAGKPASSAVLPFTDVSGDAWYCEAVRWAYGSGIVKGVSATHFEPNRQITREQLATMLYQYVGGIAGISYFEDGPLADFADIAEISTYAHDPMCWAVCYGLLQGVGGDRLAPKTCATRAQAAAILVRMNEMLRTCAA